MSNCIVKMVEKFWGFDFSFNKKGSKTLLWLALSVLALLSELLFHNNLRALPEAFHAQYVTVFYNVKSVFIGDLPENIGFLLVAAAVGRTVFSASVGILDLIFYKKITGRNFNYEAMVTMAIVNLIFLLTVIFAVMNPLVLNYLGYYSKLIEKIPTLINLNGVVALLLACLLGDFCFYWSHRWCHKIRFFWALGHVNHHRTQNLTQLTQAVDPQSLLLDTAGGKVFVLLLLPLVTKLFSLDVVSSGWALLVIIVFDAWTDPSHSVVLYYAEKKIKLLGLFRLFLVTPAVHYTHHSREEKHNVSDGCNFAARFTLWDRLFGTYIEPPTIPPETGLFHEESDYCLNPVRFVLHPYAKMFVELKSNKVRYWPAILFGSTSYEPPNSSGLHY
ncbi:MAG: sterol desaturase family protein [Formosimonas sp.]